MTKAKDADDDSFTSKYLPAMIKLSMSVFDFSIGAVNNSGKGLCLNDNADWAQDGWVLEEGGQFSIEIISIAFVKEIVNIINFYKRITPHN